MESWFCSSWIHLSLVIIMFRNISAYPASPLRYTIHSANHSFDEAMDLCSPGVLATFKTEQELGVILGEISSGSHLHQNPSIFWVGLRKGKKECVLPTLPLRGFKWIEDGSEKSQVIVNWIVEPENTCATLRCAALKLHVDGSKVTSWGLIPVGCKNKYQFICKLGDRLTGGTPKPPNSAVPEPHNPEPVPATREPEPEPATSELPTEGPEQESDQNPKTGPEVDGLKPGSEPALVSDSCQHPIIHSARSISMDSINSSRIQVECWSNIQLELHCSGRPALWQMLDDSPANFTTLCQPCEDGFEKDASGNCLDIDECSRRSPCRHTCLNTEGSYRCVCTNEDGKHQDEDSPVCRDKVNNDNFMSSILFPVLVAVAALVVLVVVVMVIVKCCLMRRSKKRAMKKAEKMGMKTKEGTDSFETANEKGLV
ncbi:Prolow-density lipoprotein receptor-related protein 1 [Larimichthys crocea]|uniref:Prolow-density lipoprotein receptor-related protein 1 n=1 Tax=Larimichthys crocea TaxID=215358 RepID=A0A6G0IGH0_LARCR|nr:Prolow-density lipoprotein receptor-related protein 1 [Larimichthys crocea]